jgi:hypothetical protein
MRRSHLQTIKNSWKPIVVILIVLFFASVLLMLNKSATDVNKEATATTADLLTSTKDLQKSFGPPINSEQTADSYIIIMNRLLKDCDQIKKLKSLPVDEATSSRLNNSSALCQDLSKLAGGSSIIYKATQPLLASSTHAKRYQTLPLFKNMIRQKHTKTVTAATQQITDQIDTIGYPTQALILLKQLQSDIESKKDLAYFPALQNFQNQLLAERQQYWTAYGDLAGLTRSLNEQLNGYCQSLQATGTNLAVCPKD